MPTPTYLATIPHPTTRLAILPAWIGAILVSLALLLAPALWNGFPIIFHDTGGYIGRVLEMNLAPGRSFFYGVFLWATSLGWWSFFGAVLAQSLVTLRLIHLLMRCHHLPHGPLPLTLISSLLTLGTGISWYTAQLMPDILVPLTVLSLWLLGFRSHCLQGWEKLELSLVALLGLLSHMSCLALGIGLAAIILFARWVSRNWRLGSQVTPWPPLSVVVGALVLMPLVHGLLLGQWGFTPGGPAFLYGRLVQDGVAQRWLAENCPVPGIKLCGLQERLPNTADDFLWNGGSPFMDIGAWNEEAGRELGFLVKRSFLDLPGMTLGTGLVSAAQQLMMTATGDGLDEFHGAARGTFSSDLGPAVSQEFNAARQQEERFTEELFAPFNRVHLPVANVSTLALLLVAAWGIWQGRGDLAVLALFTFTALCGNALICGALSNPHDRYQSRLVWIATLVVLMAGAAMLRRRPYSW